MDPENYSSSLPIQNLSDIKQVIFDSLIKDDEEWNRAYIARIKRVSDFVGNVDRTKLPLYAQHLVWMLEVGNMIGDRDYAYLLGELNELKRNVKPINL